MNKSDLPNDIPQHPGIYYFHKDNEILYIGKATSLRDRIKSYWNPDIDTTRGPKIVTMRRESTHISWHETPSVLEALILESHAIKKHQPPYNTRDKDNKSYNYVIITDEEYPRIFTMREREILKQQSMTVPIKRTFGPYPHGNTLRQALKIIRKIFPFRDKKSRDITHERFYQSLNLTPDMTRDDSKKIYHEHITNIERIFEGKMTELTKELENQMTRHAQNKEFEKAAYVKRKLFALQHIEDISLIKDETYAPSQALSTVRIEGYDVAHLGGTDPVGVMTVIIDGEISQKDYRIFNITNAHTGSDTHALEEVLVRRLQHPQWGSPSYIVVDGGTAQKRVAERVLRNYGHEKIPVISVVKDARHKPKELRGQSKIINTYKKEILLVNHEAHRFALRAHTRKRNAKKY